MHLQGHFLNSAHGKLFITQTGEIKGNTAILCLPPIMDEMNMSRAVIAKQCQYLSAQGYPSFVLDYFGCGDSEGEFEQAHFSIWLENIVTASYWLEQQGINRLIIFAYRFSALLAGASQDYLLKNTNLKAQVLFKPVLDGKTYLNQLNRLKKAQTLLTQPNAPDTNKSMENEIAGYTISADLIESIELLNLKPSSISVPTTCVELASSRVSLSTQKLVNASDSIVSAEPLACPAFWQVPEVFDVPSLNDLSLSLVKRFL